MGNYSEMSFSDIYKPLWKELCCETEKFEHEPCRETLKNIKDILESISELQEIEAGSAMRDFAEDRWGYNMDDGMPSHYGLPGLYNNVPMRSRGNRGRSMQGDYSTSPNTRYGYPTYGPNRGNMYPGGMPGYGDNDRMDRTGREDGSKMGYDDEPYILRQENGKPRMTPYAMHTGVVPKKMTDEEYKEWMQNLVNSDGTDGSKWTKQQIESEAKKIGLDYSGIGIDALWACVNMMYSDYCEVAQKYGVNNPGFYIHLADAFLNDDDFDGTGKEKLSIYYHTIAGRK